MALETEPRVEDRTTRYTVEVRLQDGQAITADLGEDERAARSELKSLHDRLNAGGFVVIGDTALVRGQEVKYVVLQEADEGSEQGFLDALRSRVSGGGGGMSSSYETQPMQAPSRGARTQPDGGPGLEQWVGYGRRPWAETKPFFLTSEFLTLIGTILAVAIAMAASDLLDAGRGWLLITILSTGYMLSRGIAKAGTKDPNPQER